MQILSTGGSGFLGSALARHLYCARHAGDDVVLDFVAAERPDDVIHTACVYGRGGEGTLALLDHRMFGLKTAVFRHSSMYGGRQFATVDQGWIGCFCQIAAESGKGLRREPFHLGQRQQVRDVLHADQMVDLYFATAAHTDDAAGRAFGIENSLSLLQLFRLLKDSIGSPLEFVRLPTRACDQRVFVADTRKVAALCNWKPKVSAEQGVARIAAMGPAAGATGWPLSA